MVREMLVRLLSSQDGIEVVGSAGTISEAKAIARETRPDLVLLGISLPDGSGVELAKDLKTRRPELKVVFLTAYDSEETALAAIDTGAEGYIGKRSSCEDLLNAVRSVASGGYAFDPSVVAPILRRVAKSQPLLGDTTSQPKSPCLSAREREIAVLVAKGMTNQEIAAATFVSVNTVKTHLRRIYQQLGISSRKELARYQDSFC
jgi:DNA-binding NarL/FixJ family response regulator